MQGLRKEHNLIRFQFLCMKEIELDRRKLIELYFFDTVVSLFFL